MQDESVPAVVLAAGAGKRLSPLTNTRPKPMLPVANRPLLEYVLEAIIDAGIEDVIFVVGYRQERIRNHFGDGDEWGVSIRYVEQRNQLGTGHAIVQVENVVDGPFLVLNGDRVIDPSIIEHVRDAGESPTLAITRVNFPSTFGVVEVEGDRLASIEEKPLDPSPSAQINAGVYCFDESIFSAIKQTPTVDGEYPITATLDRLEDVRVIRYDGTWLDVTYLWDLVQVNAIRVEEDGFDCEESTQRSGSQVAQDTVLGTGSVVGTNATIRGGTSIGENVRIGAGAVIGQSVVLADVEIGAGTILDDCVVGANAKLGGNVTVASGPSDVVVEGTVHEDVPLGAVIGDNVEIGAGAVLAPGTIIGDGARIAAGVRLSGCVEPNATVRRG